MAYAIQMNPSALSFGARIAEINAQFAKAYKTRRVYRRTLAELEALSSRELDDLGLNRSMIRSVALEAAYGKAA